MNLQDYFKECRDRLRESGLSDDDVVRLANGALSKSWISKFRNGKMTNPRIGTLEAVREVLETADASYRGPDRRLPVHREARRNDPGLKESAA